MHAGKEVYRSIKVTDNTKTSSLGLMDQIRLLCSSLSHDDVKELDAYEKLSVDKLRKLAALKDFFEKAISRLEKSKEDSVTLSISSEFLNCIDEVVSEDKGYGKYYNIQVFKRDPHYTAPHKFIVRISLKG